MDPEEILIGDEWVIRLDDNVVEVLHRTGSHRFHVTHVAVEAKPQDDGGLRLRVGVEADGEIVEGTTVDVPPEFESDVTELFGEARRRREELQE